MCKYCTPDEDGVFITHLAGDGHKVRDDHGFAMIMGLTKGAHIENSKFVQHKTLDNTLGYIKAFEWDKTANRHHNIVTAIEYCPFCGRKL